MHINFFVTILKFFNNNKPDIRLGLVWAPAKVTRLPFLPEIKAVRRTTRRFNSEPVLCLVSGADREVRSLSLSPTVFLEKEIENPSCLLIPIPSPLSCIPPRESEGTRLDPTLPPFEELLSLLHYLGTLALAISIETGAALRPGPNRSSPDSGKIFSYLMFYSVFVPQQVRFSW